MLEVEALTIDLPRARGGALRAVDSLSFRLFPDEILGVVGRSGSGKSVLALGIAALLPDTATVSGTIRFEGTDLLTLPEKALCSVRGRRIGLIFQEPMTALNPAMTVGNQVAEGPRLDGLSRGAARAQALAILDRVRIAQASRRFDAYPHELSGGQRQRIVIAIALSRRPALLIADEPTTALDMIVQKDILDLLDEVVRDTRMGLMLISHDMGVIARIADRVLVIEGGRAVERGPVADVLTRPASETTRALLAALPARVRGGRLAP